MSEVIELVLAVEKEQVLEGFGREERIVKQKIQLFHGFGQVFIDVHHRLVVERDRVKTVHIDTLRHASNRPLGLLVLAREILDGCLQVEGLDQARLSQDFRGSLLGKRLG